MNRYAVAAVLSGAFFGLTGLFTLRQPCGCRPPVRRGKSICGKLSCLP